MTNFEKFKLWQFTPVSDVNESISIVKNNNDGRLMLMRISHADNFPVMQALSEIDHPCLMHIYDTVLQGGKCLSLCEYIGGYTLDHYIEQNGPVSEQVAKSIMFSVCDGLLVLHSKGIVHRDINPANIMIDISGNVKIIDFDITRLEKEGKKKDTTILGTAGYASPEQFGFSQTDDKADIYSCGVLLNYLLTGKLPGDVMCSGRFKNIVAKCIEIDKNNRYDNIEKFKEALEKKHHFMNIQDYLPLPGFRGKNIIVKSIAFIFMFLYVVTFIMILIQIISEFSSRSASHNIMTIVDFLCIYILMTGVPYFMIGDVLKLAPKINPGNPEKGHNILTVIGFISIVLGFFIIRLV